jgi:hypothetical protein
VGGSCSNALRAAQVVSILLIIGGLIGLFINHRRTLTPAEIMRAAGPLAAPTAPDEASELSAKTTETEGTEPEPARTAERLREAHAASGEADS